MTPPISCHTLFFLGGGGGGGGGAASQISDGGNVQMKQKWNTQK